MAFHGGQFPPIPTLGQWNMPFREWWLDLPSKPTMLTFTLKQRLFGPMRSHTGQKLGIISRLCYNWLYTDDPYFVRVDQELRMKGL
jgi:hypothetical protein